MEFRWDQLCACTCILNIHGFFLMIFQFALKGKGHHIKRLYERQSPRITCQMDFTNSALSEHHAMVPIG